jgi:hypothetical protein
VDILSERIFVLMLSILERLGFRSLAVNELDPLEVVLDEVIKGRGCNFNVGTVCKTDCHSTSFAGSYISLYIQ